LSGNLFPERQKYTTRNRKRTPSTFRATPAHERRTNCEWSVKVFNSSVEIHVEKHPATIEIACRNRNLLLFAQVLVQASPNPSRCEIKFLEENSAEKIA